MIYQDGDHYAFLITAGVTSVVGIILKEVNKESKNISEIDRKEAFLVAFLCWLVACIFGSIPYLVLPIFSNPVDAIFESIAGFTTTGSSVIDDLSVLPHGLLFYRSFTQWLGGMGIIVLALAILPRLSVGGMQLMGMESPGPVTEKVTPKISETAKKLWIAYIGLSLILIVLLFICGMPLFDSVVISFSTLSTGGFAINNASIGGYKNSLIEIIIMIFMFIAGINFLLHYFLFTGRFSRVFKDSELKFYFFIVLVFIAIVCVDLWYNSYYGFWQSLRYSSFQVISIITTTGFSSVDFAHWPIYTVFLLFTLMFIGACAGSTSGSIKVLRILLLVKRSYREINHLIKPRAVLPLRINQKVLGDDIISSVTSFFVLYIFIFVLSTIAILTFEDISILGAMSTTAASIGNIGPAFEELGPSHTYHFLSNYSKVWLCFLMLIGRLELYTVLVIFTPMFWKK
ncbi:MAG: TrkH family potassium uptake protein [Candidatus Dadabacteria bacterium]|nr:TrkH family potassium uptake protein [Candidatus Dadabacteria bacterium]NIS08246.1 TrkH family potassium uptake protein [Candidatus Dadabacteria bacterium]NIV41513.1 TrkH family potassium uptake protein [Candidatus Dadabacteria bacterium]NIY21734.1 TrkH family potassium uptake protein [Candidatus Dadabacteria bacterium]